MYMLQICSLNTRRLYRVVFVKVGPANRKSKKMTIRPDRSRTLRPMRPSGAAAYPRGVSVVNLHVLRRGHPSLPSHSPLHKAAVLMGLPHHDAAKDAATTLSESGRGGGDQRNGG